jgi:phosphoribosylamine--glycine ligase
MKARGAPFRGILYAGLMVEGDRYGVLEFNARFGDPEAQVLLHRMEGPLLPWLAACVKEGGLAGMPARVPVREESSVIVIAAAEGYPGAPILGAKIEGVEPVSLFQEPKFLFAGVSSAPGSSSLQVSGGRVLGAIARGVTLEAARGSAYQALQSVRFAGMQSRKDIAC